MMKRIVLPIGFMLVVLIGFNVCAAKELADCLQTGDCEEYEPPAEDGNEGAFEIEKDSVSTTEFAISKKRMNH